MFNALFTEDLKDLEEIEWSKACKLLENAIQSLHINDSMRISFEELLKICRSRIK